MVLKIRVLVRICWVAHCKGLVCKTNFTSDRFYPPEISFKTKPLFNDCSFYASICHSYGMPAMSGSSCNLSLDRAASSLGHACMPLWILCWDSSFLKCSNDNEYGSPFISLVLKILQKTAWPDSTGMKLRLVSHEDCYDSSLHVQCYQCGTGRSARNACSEPRGIPVESIYTPQPRPLGVIHPCQMEVADLSHAAILKPKQHVCCVQFGLD